VRPLSRCTVRLATGCALGVAISVAAAPVTAAAAPTAPSPAAPTAPSPVTPVPTLSLSQRIDAAYARAAALAGEVRRLREAASLATQAARDTATRLGQVASAQAQAQHRLELILTDARQQQQASTARAQQLMAAGGQLGVIGELLVGGQPSDLLDRAQVAAVISAGDAADRAKAKVFSAQATAASAQLTRLADAQLTLAARAGRRAAEVHNALGRTSALLAAAVAIAHRADVQGAVARAAEGAAARDGLVGAAASIKSARSAAAEVFGVVRRAGTAGGTHLPAGVVPSAYRTHVEHAGRRCPTLSPALLAAQLVTESGWNPTAVSRAGAQGLAQFLSSTWAGFGVDGDHDGSADPYDPIDAIYSAASYDCALVRIVARLQGDVVSNMLAGYNAGPDAVLAAGGIPDIAETQAYVARIRALEPLYRPPAGTP